MLTEAEIKRHVPIEAVVAHYGGNLDAKGKGRCLLPHHHTHGDADPSMTVKDGRVRCWSQACFGENGADVFGLVGVMESLSGFGDQRRRVCEIGGLTEGNQGHRRLVATYDYLDESGEVRFQVVRFEPKAFAQRRPNGQNGWNWNLKDTQLVLYRLPEVLKAQNVLVVEGEKDVDEAYRRGLPEGWAATCNPMGAGKWRKEYTEALRGKRVVILPDADQPGHRHAEQVARSLKGIALELMTVILPGGSKDLSEWVALGNENDELKGLLQSAQAWPFTDVDEPEVRSGVCLVPANSIKPESVKWAWEKRIPLGTLTIVAGDPGLGKSTVTMNLAANWTHGNVEGTLKGVPVAVVIASAEDSPSATMVPRLKAAGADLSRVHFVTVNRDGISDGVNLPDDIDALSKQIQKVGAKILIVDPLMAHLPSSVNANRDQHIRRALAPLARMAEQLALAVIVVVHLNKDEQKAVLARVGGSMGIVAAARSVLLVAPDPSDPDNGLRMLGHAKCNVGRHASTLCFRIVSHQITEADENLETSCVQWEGEAPALVASDLLVRMDRNETGDRAEAREWLKDYLAHGPQPSQQLLQEGKKEGFSESTVKRAKKDLGVKSVKVGFGEQSHWCSQLPEEDQPSAKEGQASGSDLLSGTNWNAKPFDAGSPEEGQQPSTGPLRENAGLLRSPYPVGTQVQYKGGLGFTEIGTIEAILEESPHYPGQVCYRMENGRTFPHERVVAVVEAHQ